MAFGNPISQSAFGGDQSLFGFAAPETNPIVLRLRNERVSPASFAFLPKIDDVAHRDPALD